MEFGLGLTKFVAPLIFLSAFAVFFLTIFYRIEVGIFFLVPFIPLQNILNYANAYPFGKDINDLIILAMLIRWAIDARKREKFFQISPLKLLIIVFIFWTYIELWRGASYLGFPAPLSLTESRVIAWKNFLMLPLLFFIVLNNIKTQKHVEILLILMTLSMLSLDRNFYNAAAGRDFSEYTEWRFTGASGQALSGNALAVFQAQYSALLLFLFLSSKKTWHKALYGVTLIFNYYCLMFSFSRSGYLAAAVTLGFAGLVKDRRLLAALIIVAIFWKALLPLSVQQRIEMTKTEEGYDATVMERIGMWELAKTIISENPVAGAGFAVTRFLNIQVSGFQYTWASFHSGYVETTVELGFLGLILYLLFFLLGIHGGWKLYRVSDDELFKSLGLGFIGCVLGVLGGNIAGTYWNYMNVMGFYWVLLALVLRSTIIVQEQLVTEKITEPSAPIVWHPFEHKPAEQPVA